MSGAVPLITIGTVQTEQFRDPKEERYGKSPTANADSRYRRGRGSRAVRCDYYRCRGYRAVSVVPPASARALGSGLRRWWWSGRYLVLEPLSRGALRLRELHLWIFVLRGTSAGMGLERTFFRTAGERTLPQLCSGQV